MLGWRTLFLVILRLVTPLTATSTSQILGLQLLYNSTRGEDWNWRNETTNGPRWSFDSPQSDPCSADGGKWWQGVVCSSNGSVCASEDCDIMSIVLVDYGLDGTIPPEFFSALPTLTELVITLSPLLLGSISSNVGSLTALETLSLSNNQLSGAIPESLELCQNLKYLHLSSNNLDGFIPYGLSSLSNLLELTLSDNSLTGGISYGLYSLSKLEYLSLKSNLLSGTLSTAFSRLTNLEVLALDVNYLSSTLPSHIGYLTNLIWLDLDGNSLSGTVPFELTQLPKLEFFSLLDNFLTGSIPFAPSTQENLEVLHYSGNRFTGPFPEGLLTRHSLNTLDLSENLLTGSIPSSITNLANLTMLELHQNHFRGHIDFKISAFPRLEQLYLQRNSFSGSLHGLFQDYNSAIMTIDVSDNLFSSSIPRNVFLLSSLETISMSLNCFDGELPSSICETNAEVLLMDGLAAAKNCRNTITVPFTSVSLGLTIDGGIPNCIWQLSRLRMLHLAGNGLTGSIGESHNPSLRNLILSHNYLSGNIPSWLQDRQLIELDLSHNKLNGEILGYKSQSHSPEERSLVLSVNRLSGHLVQSFDNYSSLNILTGNIFDCESIPSIDSNSEWYTCGSSQYDFSLSVMVTIMGCSVLLVFCYYLCLKSISLPLLSDWAKRRLDEYHTLLNFFKYSTSMSLQELLPIHLNSVFSFTCLLSSLLRDISILTGLTLLLTFPIYCLKLNSINDQESKYVTHTHMYRWLWSMSFLSGGPPAALLLVATFFCLVFFCHILNSLNSRRIKIVTSVDKIGHELKDKYFSKRIVWGVLFLNVTVVGAVYGLYIWSTLGELSPDFLSVIQMLVGTFIFLWNAFIGAMLPSKTNESEAAVWLFLRINIFNSVILPCIVAALSSPSCYQRLLVAPKDITSSYIYRSCVLRTFDNTCVEYDFYTSKVLSVTPPFSYSYQCGSTLLVTYIPVYIYSISFQILLLLFLLIVVYFSHNQRSLPTWLKIFPGICYPLSCLSLPNEAPIMIRPSRIFITIMNNTVLLLSFGLCSPLLACYILFCICLNLCSWKMLIGRFASIRSEHQLEVGRQARDDPFIAFLNNQLTGIHNYLLVCKWPGVWTSCLFISILAWDMVGDRVGWYRALWAPGIGVGMIFLIWQWDRYSRRFYIDEVSSRNPSSYALSLHELPSVLSSLHSSPSPDSVDTPRESSPHP